MIAQGGVDQRVARCVGEAGERSGRAAGEAVPLHRDGQRHQQVVEPPLEPGGFGNADLHVGEHRIPAPRRSEVDGGGDLAQVVQHSFLALGNVDGEAQGDAGGQREDEVADPGHGQIGHQLIAGAEVIRGLGITSGGNDAAVLQHHALRLPRGAGGMQQHGGIRRTGPVDEIIP